MKRIALTLALIATLAFAGTAAAAPSVTPNGWTGSCNMLTGYLNGGLGNAFANESDNGWDGKWHSVSVTTGNTEQDGCK
jgi:hypothetical protein